MTDISAEFRAGIVRDLTIAADYKPELKDICVVVHNQLPYVKKCLASVMSCTKDYRLHVWDNASEPSTMRYLMSMAMDGDITYSRSPMNQGFIGPANALAASCTAPYVVMLNSDTEVSPGWDGAMIAPLQREPDVAQVGYMGGLLDKRGQGGVVAYGYDVDYIWGWCFAVRRRDFQPNPLFDSENLKFAYAEDSDLSLRFREGGRRLYALHLELVRHYENRTIREVARDEAMAYRMSVSFEENHAYIRRRWADYLATRRFGLHVPSQRAIIPVD